MDLNRILTFLAQRSYQGRSLIRGKRRIRGRCTKSPFLTLFPLLRVTSRTPKERAHPGGGSGGGVSRKNGHNGTHGHQQEKWIIRARLETSQKRPWSHPKYRAKVFLGSLGPLDTSGRVSFQIPTRLSEISFARILGLAEYIYSGKIKKAASEVFKRSITHRSKTHRFKRLLAIQSGF